MKSTRLDGEIEELVSRVAVHRALENYLGTFIPSPSGLVAGTELPGNLGSLLFKYEGNAFGQRLLACSHSIRYEFKDYLRREGLDALVVAPLDERDCWIEQGDLAIPIKATFGKDSKRPHDSEYLLVNALNWFLVHNRITTGDLHLMTERIPCKSCTKLLVEFKKKYPNIGVTVWFIRETLNRRVKGSVTRTGDDFMDETRGLGMRLEQFQILPVNAETRVGPE